MATSDNSILQTFQSLVIQNAPTSKSLIGRLLGKKDLVILTDPVEVETKRSQWITAEQVLILGADSPVWDYVKTGFIDYVSIGGTPSDSKWLWWGGRRSLEQAVPPSKGELPLIISFHTNDDFYTSQAQNLRESLEALGLPHIIRGVEPLDSWEKNCLLKPEFVWQVWQEVKQPILWVNCDAILRRPPELLRTQEFDWGVYKVDRYQMAAGTLYFNNTRLAGELIENWVMRCRSQPDSWDLIEIHLSWEEISKRSPLRTCWLPQTYTKIFDRPIDKGESADPVIEHFQASRKARPTALPDPAKKRHPKYPDEWIEAGKYCRPRLNDEIPTFYW